MTEFDTLLGMELISKKNYNDKGILETEMFYDLNNVLVQHVTYNENGDQIKIMNFVNGVLSAVEEYVEDSNNRLVYENHYDGNENLTHYYHFIYDKNGEFTHEDYYEVE